MAKVKLPVKGNYRPEPPGRSNQIDLAQFGGPLYGPAPPGFGDPNVNRRLFTACACFLSGTVAGCGSSAPPEVAAVAPAESPPVEVPATPPSPSPAEKLEAMRQAVGEGHAAGCLKYLHDADATVRRGAILAVGPEANVGAEELFKSLHDADGEVRELAVTALRSRGLNLNQVSFARQFSHPDPAERLAVLNELSAGAVANPGPWLARLGEDSVPAVRLGAARVASELGLKAQWVGQIARDDADPAVREWAAYYRDAAGEVARVGHRE